MMRIVEELRKELNHDRNYLLKKVGNTTIRSKLIARVFCHVCDNTECVANPLPFDSSTLLAVICKNWEFNYVPKS
jgi:hypothetical protein